MKIVDNINDFENILFSYADNNPNRKDKIQLLGLQEDGVSVLLSNLFGKDIEIPRSELYIAFDNDFMIVFESEIYKNLTYICKEQKFFDVRYEVSTKKKNTLKTTELIV